MTAPARAPFTPFTAFLARAVTCIVEGAEENAVGTDGIDVAVVLGNTQLHVTPAGQLVGPSLFVQRVVCPAHVQPGGQLSTVWVPPGNTHVAVS